MSKEDLKRRVLEIINRLEKEHPDAKIALNFSNPLELLVATILAAQCTDERVNQVTRNLFKKYRSAEDYANADINVLEQDIKPTGYYRVKARRIKEVCKILVEKFNSEVPKTMEGLLSLPGVARKTANIVLTNAYGINEGIIVDTHVLRLAKRLGLTESKTRERIEKDLMEIVPKDKWGRFADLLIFHGRRVCKARKPNCEMCVLKDLCPSRETAEEPERDD
ncbi:endonuclease III [Candidatus Bathyarchaeota archaeon]|nr:endonuclease III [Candidatus Bathyarchaeota archaeon]